MIELHAVSAGTPAKRQSGNVPRILVVDDEPLICEMNVELLACAGYHVDSAANGAMAWEAMLKHHYDLIVTDHNMPIVTGVGLLEKIHAAGMDVPIVMLTGEFPHDQLSQKPWLQPDATVLKPYAFADLMDAVENLLRPVSVSTGPTPLPAPWLDRTGVYGLQPC